MRKDKALIGLLRGLADLISDESARNPEFASKVEVLLSNLPDRRPKPTRSTVSAVSEKLPDIHAEWNARGDSEFRLWLRDQPTRILRALIRKHDLRQHVGP